jgi:hypothetical protein
MQNCSGIEIATATSQVLAFLGAAAFFLYKAITGYLIVNMSLSAKIERGRKNDATDYLAIAATVKKGELGSLELHDARTHVSWPGDCKERELIGYERLTFGTDPESKRRRIVFGSTSAKKPFLRLAPGEEMTFSAILEVPASAPCEVQIAIGGIRTCGRRVGQWRTSMVSLPRDHSPKKAVG